MMKDFGKIDECCKCKNKAEYYYVSGDLLFGYKLKFYCKAHQYKE